MDRLLLALVCIALICACIAALCLFSGYAPAPNPNFTNIQIWEQP
jgi:hypothetical protein